MHTHNTDVSLTPSICNFDDMFFHFLSSPLFPSTRHNIQETPCPGCGCSITVNVLALTAYSDTHCSIIMSCSTYVIQHWHTYNMEAVLNSYKHMSSRVGFMSVKLMVAYGLGVKIRQTWCETVESLGL